MQSLELEHLKQLLACRSLSLISQSGGGNSKVFCVMENGKKWAIKSYPPYAPNQRDRLAAECAVYQFLNQHQVKAMPTLKTVCLDKRWLVIDWIEGSLPKTYDAFDIAQAVSFLGAVAKLNHVPAAQHLPLAAEACLSLDELIQQIEMRRKRLCDVNVPDSALQDFLSHDFLPCLTRYQAVAREGYRKHGILSDQLLLDAHRSLIPSDFGFHNSLRDEQGRLYFFDFDYFGWDDPVKLLADILWHPKMVLSEVEKEQFIHGISAIYCADPLFLVRFRYTVPLFGLRWVLILLNEFIPAFWQNRQHANVQGDWDEAKRIQLGRARELLTRLAW